MSLADELLAANAARVEGRPVDDLPSTPARRLAVLTCMDARLRPDDLLGLDVGDAHVLRNAGGRVTDDVVRSLMLSTAVLGARRAAVVHHTGCGLLDASNEALRARVREVTGHDAGAVDFRAFDDVDAAVRRDVGALVSDPRLAFDEVAGFVVDVRSGRLRLVVEGRRGGELGEERG